VLDDAASSVEAAADRAAAADAADSETRARDRLLSESMEDTEEARDRDPTESSSVAGAAPVACALALAACQLLFRLAVPFSRRDSVALPLLDREGVAFALEGA
jgi:hypothetical protein